MGDELNEADFDAVRIEQVRVEARELLERLGLSRTKAAKDIGVGESTFLAWMNGSYNGSNTAVAVQVQRWMTARLTQAATTAKLASGPAFVRTKTSELFCAVFEHAQYAPDFAVVVGNPGLGKTTTARAYCRTAHNTWLVSCQPSMTSVSALVTEVAETIGVQPGSAVHSISRTCKSVIRKLSGLQGLLIIDEAQHLVPSALDQLRTFHDLAGCGVVLMGNSSILVSLEGGRGSRQTHFAQLFSRVGQRIVRHKPSPDDIETILTAWNVEDNAVRKVARAVARKPGALRMMDKVLRQAHMRAHAEGMPLAERHMLASAAQLGDEKPLEMEP